MNVAPVGGKSTLYTQLVSVRKQTGKTPLQLKQYEECVIPKSLAYIYKYFQDFYNGDHFSYTELQAWESFIGFKLTYIEAELIRQLCLERTVFDAERARQTIEHERQNNKPKRR